MGHPLLSMRHLLLCQNLRGAPRFRNPCKYVLKCTEVRFDSFLSGAFTTAIVVNLLERQLANCISVWWVDDTNTSRGTEMSKNLLGTIQPYLSGGRTQSALLIGTEAPHQKQNKKVNNNNLLVLCLSTSFYISAIFAHSDLCNEVWFFWI